MAPKDWLWLLFEIFGILLVVITFVWKAVKQPIEYELRDIKIKLSEGLKSQGERLGEIESEGRARRQSLEELRRMDQQHSFEIASLVKEQGRTEGMLERIQELIEGERAMNNNLQIALAQLRGEIQRLTETNEFLATTLKKDSR